jgi:hypothetical protein
MNQENMLIIKCKILGKVVFLIFYLIKASEIIDIIIDMETNVRVSRCT